jgi:hypothetical protein
MCTVSFLASKNAFVFTSNRDEHIARAAIEPKSYLINGATIFFPKDPLAGGTWFGVNKNGTIIVLLNGAEFKHKHLPPYNRSRGLVVLEMISNKNSIDFWNDINLQNVEPFTLVLFQEQNLYQLRWNGEQKFKVVLNVNEKHIWSSSTLYSKEIAQNRAKWFFDFTNSLKEISSADMLNFHENTHTENTENGLVMKRSDVLKTISITQTVIYKNHIYLIYKDLTTAETFENNIEISK